ncbi:helix-turn-helix domain-containing protein [Streptomyces albidoflavus]|uniref:helix-turn-helix domain-containing protein n=1 Tax=Streptomyces albidoflavus TaxID=1886 RepID=UPI001EF2D7F5
MAIVVDIDRRLAELGMSVGEFAEAVGITPANIAVLKNGPQCGLARPQPVQPLALDGHPLRQRGESGRQLLGAPAQLPARPRRLQQYGQRPGERGNLGQRVVQRRQHGQGLGPVVAALRRTAHERARGPAHRQLQDQQRRLPVVPPGLRQRLRDPLPGPTRHGPSSAYSADRRLRAVWTVRVAPGAGPRRGRR